jgi:surfactin family lipopeptide synthetase A
MSEINKQSLVKSQSASKQCNEILKTQLEYWKQQLAGAPFVLELPTDKQRHSQQSFQADRELLKLDADLTQKLKSLNQQSGTTLFMSLLAILVSLLSRYTHQKDVLVGVAVKEENSSEWASLKGNREETLVLRNNLVENPTFAQLLQEVKQVAQEAYGNADVTFEMLIEELQPELDLSRHPLVQVEFALDQEVREWSRSEESQKVEFDLAFHFWEVAEKIEGEIVYNSDLFEAATISRMVGHYQTLLASAIANPQQSVAELFMLTVAEQHQLLVEWNNTQADYPKDKCFHHLFEAQVELTPEATAVVFEQQQLTYAELNCRANQLARYLKNLGVKPEVLVGICMERSVEMIVGLLGILKAGGAYVPLDPKYPQERLDFMFKDTQVAVLLTQEHLREHLPSYLEHIVYIDTDWIKIEQQKLENLVSGVEPDNLAYVIYTSGSTGKPKGVMIEHRGLCNMVEAKMHFGVHPNSRVLQFASLSFEASVFEIAMALTVGATLCIGRKKDVMSGQIFHDQKITVAELPPSLLAVLKAQNFPHLETIISVGEACSTNIVANWATGNCRLFNPYGPTETTWYATVTECFADGQKPTIGRPIINKQVYILDDHLRPVPINVPGELHIGGLGVARGYLNRPELTKEKFIPNPFEELKTKCSDRLYKTGDRARFLANGNIEFLGRFDHQVKIRGFRIELGEIESALSQHPAVQQNVVTVCEELGDKRLVAYIVLNRKGEQEGLPENTEFYNIDARHQSDPKEISTEADNEQFSPLKQTKNSPDQLVSDFRSHLKQKLPEYMLPSTFVLLVTLPLTPNGKVDRRALPAPDQLRPELRSSFMAPRTPDEQKIAGIWAQVLKLEQIGIHDNFFELGGYSLLATKVIAHLHQAFGIELPLSTIFEAPTIAELCVALKQCAN